MGDGQEPAKAAHRVRRGAQRDSPVALGALGAGGERGRVQPVGDRAGGCLGLAVTHGREPSGQLIVRGAAILAGQAGRLADHDGGPPLADRPSPQCGQGARHLLHQRLRQADVARPLVGGVATGQRDLRRHPPPQVLAWRPREPLPGVLGGHQVRRRDRLGGRRRRLQLLQCPDLLDPLPVIHHPIDARQPSHPGRQHAGVDEPVSHIGLRRRHARSHRGAA